MFIPVRATGFGAAILATAIIGTGVVVPSAATAPAERRDTNPTGTLSGSSRNGASYLKLSLSSAPDGRIKVSWVRPSPASRLRKFVVQVGPNRKLDALVKSYRVGRRKQSVVVPRAAGAFASSGNFSFVKISVYRKGGGKGSSPTKWIQAPLAATCTATPANRVSVGTFNVRTWTADSASGPYNWNIRRARVISEILRSGVHAVAIQEASGSEGQGFGSTPQRRQILRDLNARDPRAQWVDALPDEAYRPKTKGGRAGLGGTRVFYDANRFTELSSGLVRIWEPTRPDSLIPWVRLKAAGQAPFVLTSNHLRVGEGRREFTIRGRQVATVIRVARDLRNRFHDQVIIAGDLNSTANTKPYNNVQRALLRAGMYDAYASKHIAGGKYPTTNMFKFPVRPTPHRRDYILTFGAVRGSCGYRNMAYTQRSRVASDHFMQVASLPLPPA